MLKYLTKFAMVAVILSFSGGISTAGTVSCGPRVSIVEKLGEVYGESRRGAGLMAGEDALVEIYVSEESGTWTVLKSLPNGISCIMAVGSDWAVYASEFIPTGDPV